MDTGLIFGRACALCEQSEEAFIELGELICILLDQDKALIAELCAETGLGRRKAYYLARINRRLGPLGIARERLMRIGWTKAQILSDHINPVNMHILLSLAELNPAHVLKAILTEGKPLPGSHRVMLHLDDEQFAEFEKALASHGYIGGGKSGPSRETALHTALTKSK